MVWERIAILEYYEKKDFCIYLLLLRTSTTERVAYMTISISFFEARS